MARTIYVASIPDDVNSVEGLTKIFNKFPGGVRRIWLNRYVFCSAHSSCHLICHYYRKMGDLPDEVDKRQKYVQNLETAVTKAILASYKYQAKKKDHVESGEGQFMIPEKLRPTHRVSPLPFSIPCVGRKVDSINYYNQEIHELNERIVAKQLSALDNSSPDVALSSTGGDRGKQAFPQVNSAFIEFNKQVAAHMAAQTVFHHKELTMAPRYIEIAPTDVIWDNMNISSLSRFIRRFASISITTAIVIFWAIPGNERRSMQCPRTDYHVNV